ncbi:MAG: DUF4126 domain-containing protein [Micromonosporaceae bacterium]
MLEALTGTGLAAAAGLNAYVPLVVVGLLGRYTDLITLPAAWHWLENGWALAILVVLLAVETTADKIPVVDHINDVIGTAVRPTAGGLAFSATAGAPAVAMSDPAALSDWRTLLPLAAGAFVALVVHGFKAMARPVANLATGGFAAPVVSTGEDGASVVMSVVAILAPILVLLLLGVMAAVGWRLWRRRARRKALREAPADARTPT